MPDHNDCAIQFDREGNLWCDTCNMQIDDSDVSVAKWREAEAAWAAADWN